MAVHDPVHNTVTEELTSLIDDGWISVILPYVREKGMIRCVEAIKTSTYPKYEIIAKYDQNRIGCPKMVKELVAESHYNYVCFLADDTVPHSTMLSEAIKVMATFPGGIGLVGLNSHDFHGGPNRASHWMVSKNLLPYLDGEFFHTGYKHNFCDDELVERCMAIEKYKFATLAHLRHYHPKTTMGLFEDEFYAWSYSKRILSFDSKLFTTRKNQSNHWRRKCLNVSN